MRKFSILQPRQQLHIVHVTATKRFHGEGMTATLPEMMHQQACQQGLSRSRVSPGDENNWTRSASCCRFTVRFTGHTPPASVILAGSFPVRAQYLHVTRTVTEKQRD